MAGRGDSGPFLWQYWLPRRNQRAASARDLIFVDESALRLRILERAVAINESQPTTHTEWEAKLRANPELVLIAKALELKGQHVFNFNDNEAFVVCNGDEDCGWLGIRTSEKTSAPPARDASARSTMMTSRFRSKRRRTRNCGSPRTASEDL